MKTAKACQYNLSPQCLLKNTGAKISVYGRMIKFEHSIFALPFALSALLLAHRATPVTMSQFFWIIMAVVWARSAGMGFNRLVDAYWDGKNPRTAAREIPSGKISLIETTLFVVLTSFLFVFSALAISRICFWFSFPVLFFLFLYSYTKRFTWLSHLVLGFVQALSPLGVWLAVTGDFSLKIAVLSLALATYMVGLDILYACQDTEFDRREGLYSVPANFGVRRALRVSSLMHLLTFLSFLALYRVFDLSPFYLVFVAVIGFFLALEHAIVKPDDLSRINFAFFHVNSIVSLLLLVSMLTEELIRRFNIL